MNLKKKYSKIYKYTELFPDSKLYTFTSIIDLLFGFYVGGVSDLPQ